MHRALILSFLLWLPALASAATPATHETWMSVHLQGRKIGSLHKTRSIDGAVVTTTSTLRLTIDRAGTALTLQNAETDRETRTGKVLGFDNAVKVSGSTTRIVGKRTADGRMRVTRSVAGRAHSSVIDWPHGALLSQGQRHAQRQAGFAAGTDLTLKTYDIASGRATIAHRHVVGPETVALPGAMATLTRVKTTLDTGATPRHMTLWFDAHGNLRRLRMTMLGEPLELLACSRACALAPNQPVNIFAHTMAPLPHPLDAAQRAGALRYVVRSRDGKPLHFADTDLQAVRKSADRWILQIGGAPASREAAPTAADTAATVWLQSDDPALRALAKKAAGQASGNGPRMRALQAFVSGYITHKNLSVGYASALQTMHTRSGDCTEHAVLLAALGRALDIPTRVVTGLVYMPHYAGRAHVLVPHAWVQAWVSGHWRGYDAALDGFDSGHVALNVGDGDPWHFYAGVPTLGRLIVTKVTAATATPSQAARDAKADPTAAG